MIEALLNMLFNKTDIINHRLNGEGELYLRRWFIWPRKPADLKMVPRLYLHKFYTGDSDRHLHDHPWGFRSLILRGGYREYSYNPAWKKWKATEKLLNAWRDKLTPEEREAPYQLYSYCPCEPEKLRSKWYGPGSYLKRGASWAHSVKLQTLTDGEVVPCWSLVLTGVKSRSWGFHTENGWCWWRNYTQGACVCYDNPNEDLVK